MLVLKSTEYGELWHEWATKTIELYGQTWVISISSGLLRQKAPENVSELQQSLRAKMRLFELTDKTPLAISLRVNGRHMHAIFNDIQEKYWGQSSTPDEIFEINYEVFMSCLEEGLITIAESELREA